MVVEEAEGLLVAGPGELDEGDQPAPLGFVLLRGGGVGGIAEAVTTVAAGARGDGSLAQQPTRGAGRSRATGERRRTCLEDGRGDGCAQGIQPACDVPTIPLRVDDDPPGQLPPKPCSW